MRQWVSVITYFSACIVQSGCLCIGCFVPQLPPPPKPLIEDWVKRDFSVEQRLGDWKNCGGYKDGNFSIDPGNKIEGENSEQAYSRQHANLQRCLIEKGYRYIGHCERGMKEMPACGAP